GRLAVERPDLRLDLPGDGADVLGGRYPEAEPLALLAVPSLGEVVLTQHDVTRAGLHLQAAQTTVRFPALPRCEAEHVPVPGDALLQVVHGDRRGHGAQPQRFALAAHAACFSMALSAGLEKAGKPASRIQTDAGCTLEMVNGTPTITKMELRVRGKVPGLDQAGFQKAADEAKIGCPVSRALKGIPQITLTAKLE